MNSKVKTPTYREAKQKMEDLVRQGERHLREMNLAYPIRSQMTTNAPHPSNCNPPTMPNSKKR